jgi:hypothetical protein
MQSCRYLIGIRIDISHFVHVKNFPSGTHAAMATMQALAMQPVVHQARQKYIEAPVSPSRN